MTVAEYVEAIAKANGGKTSSRRAETALIPGIEPQPIVEKAAPSLRTLRSGHLPDGRDRWHARGVSGPHGGKRAESAVVFDIKDSDGTINIKLTIRWRGRSRIIPLPPAQICAFFALAGSARNRPEAALPGTTICRNHGTLAVQSRANHQPCGKMESWVWSTVP